MLSLSHLTPLRLFRQGNDTLDIARILGCTEATACRMLHDERDAERIEYRKAMETIGKALEGLQKGPQP